MRTEIVEQKKRRQRRPGRIALNILVALLVIVLGYALIWLQPMAAKEPALSALKSGNSVHVSTSSELISFLPANPAEVGLIFYQGALVDPRAYASYMRTFAENGYATFIIKMPYNISFLGMDNADSVIAAYPGIRTWAIAGHSLGGVSACVYAAAHPKIKGLLLYGSYPANDLSKQLNGKVVVSIYGTKDGLTTLSEIERSKLLLPADTQFVAISGGIHSFFGDYGLQSGDGQPTINREQARQEITTASLDFLARLARM